MRRELIAAAFLTASCGTPPATPPLSLPPAPSSALALGPQPIAPTPSTTVAATATTAAAEPSKPAEPRVGADAARESATTAFRRLQPAIPSTAQLEPSITGPTCTAKTCAWRWRILLAPDSLLGTLEVDGETGAVVYAPDDNKNRRFTIDVFLARDAEHKKAVASVEALPVVKAYCKRVVAQRLGCLTYFEDDPTDEACGASPPLESSCWLTVYVGEAHATHASRFATFLVTPGTYRVVGASGLCGPMPLARFNVSPTANCND